MIAPGISAGLDGDEAIAAIGIRERSARASKIRIERRGVLILHMQISPGGVSLPDFDQGVRNGASIFIEHTAGDEDALTQRIARVLASEIVIRFADRIVPI